MIDTTGAYIELTEACDPYGSKYESSRPCKQVRQRDHKCLPSFERYLAYDESRRAEVAWQKLRKLGSAKYRGFANGSLPPPVLCCHYSTVILYVGDASAR